MVWEIMLDKVLIEQTNKIKSDFFSMNFFFLKLHQLSKQRHNQF